MKNLIVLIGVLILFSCEKTVFPDLEQAEQTLVIEGIIDTNEESSFVKITLNNPNFYDTVIRPVTDLNVTITDNLGNQWQLSESEPGFYTDPDLIGEFGITYNLEVIYNGESITASSTLPLSNVQLEEFRYELDESNAGAQEDEDGIETDENGNEILKYFVESYYQDPADEQNFYAARIFQNGERFDDINTQDDEFNNGRFTFFPLFGYNFASGDTVKVTLVSITREVHDYLLILEENSGGGVFGAIPENPEGLFSNPNVFGYFSTQSSNSLSEVVPEDPLAN